METSTIEQNPSPSVSQQPSTCRPKRKRKRKDFGTTNKLYEDISFSKRASTGRPGTPHRYFTSSYDVHVTATLNSRSSTTNATNDSANDEDIPFDNHESPSRQRVNNGNDDTTNVKETSKVTPFHNVKDFVVHCHVNGLCMITIGESIKNKLDVKGDAQTVEPVEPVEPVEHDDLLVSNTQTKKNIANDEANSSDQKVLLYDSDKAMVQKQLTSGWKSTSNLTISKVHFMVETSTSQTVGQKRKQAKKMKKGARQNNHKNISGMVQPGDVIATIHVSDGSVIHVQSCINGSILELNENLKSDPNLLLEDPLLDGYVAVILPNGPFPPNKRIESNVNEKKSH